MLKKILVTILIASFTLFFSACASESPKQVAAAPKNSPIAVFPNQIAVVYQGNMEVQVADVDSTSIQIERLAGKYGGYLAGTQSWWSDGRKITILELAVPTANFASLCNAVRGLGSLVSESISSIVVSDKPSSHFSSLTVQLRSEGSLPPPPDHNGWDPLRTVQRAWQVFLTIFGFLADILIWVVIVGGPFVLIALGIGVLMRRLRKPLQ